MRRRACCCARAGRCSARSPVRPPSSRGWSAIRTPCSPRRPHATQALAAAIRAFPAFTVATRLTVDRVHRFAALAKPLINELRPAAVQLTPTLQKTVILAPELLTLIDNLAPLTQASKTGVPAFDRFLTVSVPWLRRLTPYLGNFVPIFNYINTYRRELAAFFANSSAVSEATGAEHHPDQAAALPADLEPGQPGDADRLPAPAREQPRQPVHGARRLPAADQRARPCSATTCARPTHNRASARRFRLTSSPTSRTCTTRPSRAAPVQGSAAPRPEHNEPKSDIPATQALAMSYRGESAERLGRTGQPASPRRDESPRAQSPAMSTAGRRRAEQLPQVLKED